MSGYLDHYGAGEEKRNRLLIRAVISVLAIVIVSALVWYLLKNRRQENLVKNFVTDVRSGDLRAAYSVWGCTTSKPCSGYDYSKFVSDWGQAAAMTAGTSSNSDGPPDPAVLGLTDSESCNNGVLLTVQVNRTRTEKLWVDQKADSIDFAPYPICPHKSPFAIMMHRTIGQLRKPLLK